MLTDSLTSETDTEKRSISSFSNYFSESIHFWISDIIDITRSTSEDEDIFTTNIFSIIADCHFCPKRFHHHSEYVGEIIFEVDNRYFFSNKLGRRFELVLFSEVESAEKFISR